MSDNEDDEASDEGEDIIREFDRLNFNQDNDSNFHGLMMNLIQGNEDHQT